MERLALLAVTAHPGDELAMAGTLARHVEAGVHVALACTTRGALGPPTAGHRPGELGSPAEHDLRCVCTRLGVGELHMLGYHAAGRDGKSDDPEALVRASACDVVRRLVQLIRQLRPQVMVTFGPDGLNGHADHVAVGGLATQAFGAAGDLEQFPRDGGPAPYAPAKLYYLGLPEGLLRLAGIRGRGTPDAAIAAREDVSQFVDLKLDAARCYGVALESQLAGLYQLAPAERQHLLSIEYLNLALPQPQVDDRRDPHLFAGIP